MERHFSHSSFPHQKKITFFLGKCGCVEAPFLSIFASSHFGRMALIGHFSFSSSVFILRRRIGGSWIGKSLLFLCSDLCKYQKLFQNEYGSFLLLAFFRLCIFRGGGEKLTRRKKTPPFFSTFRALF